MSHEIVLSKRTRRYDANLIAWGSPASGPGKAAAGGPECLSPQSTAGPPAPRAGGPHVRVFYRFRHRQPRQDHHRLRDSRGDRRDRHQDLPGGLAIRRDRLDGAMPLRDATCDSVSSPSRSSLTHLDLNSGGYALWDFPFSDMPFRLPFTPSPEMVGVFLRRVLSCPEIASHINSPNGWARRRCCRSSPFSSRSTRSLRPPSPSSASAS